jgi:hypothetical protein
MDGRGSDSEGPARSGEDGRNQWGNRGNFETPQFPMDPGLDIGVDFKNPIGSESEGDELTKKARRDEPIEFHILKNRRVTRVISSKFGDVKASRVQDKELSRSVQAYARAVD